MFLENFMIDAYDQFQNREAIRTPRTTLLTKPRFVKIAMTLCWYGHISFGHFAERRHWLQALGPAAEILWPPTCSPGTGFA
jgi:hypothetical protein